MKINKSILVILLLSVSSQFSFGQTKFTEQKAGHIFYVAVPDYLVKTWTLNDVADMQYMNSAKSAYMLVIEDSKEELEQKGIKYAALKDFHDDNIKTLKTEANNGEETKAVEFKANGNSFYQSDLSVTLKQDDNTDLKITYLITYVETKGYYYQILCWTLSSKYKELLPDFKKVAASLRD